MNIEFIETKNKKVSAQLNNIKFHSVYDPEKEAERFVDNLKFDFIPENLFITEPAVSYILPFLQKKFPETQLICIRFTKDFSRYNSGWNKIINYENPEQFENELNNFTEETICSSSFLEWTPSAKAFPEICSSVWNIIKNTIIRSRSLLFTRSFFAKRWILNQINFIKYLNKINLIQNGSKDVMICASGISLSNSIKKIINLRKNFFIISVSSATDYLIKNKIIPDLVISTDGGYWAQKHIEILLKKNIPLALATEGNCQKPLLEKCNIIPLEYTEEKGEPERISKKLNIPSIIVERNGTVSGTALSLALKITTGKIFFCGLDLSPSPAYQHSQPNKLEILNNKTDYKIKPLQKRLASSMFNSESLKIYEKWFTDNSSKFKKRVFRISDNYNFSNKLGMIEDINFEILEKIISKDTDEIIIKSVEKKQIDWNQIISFTENLESNLDYLKNIFPAEYISMKKELNFEKKEEKIRGLKEKGLELSKKIKRIIYE